MQTPFNLYEIPAGKDAPEIVNVIIEVPRNSSNKYEYDKEFGVIKLDRVLYANPAYRQLVAGGADVDGALGVVLANDETVEFGDDFAGRELGHGSQIGRLSPRREGVGRSARGSVAP